MLQAEQSLFPAELTLASVRASVFASTVNIYKAMGGGWVAEADRLTGSTPAAAAGHGAAAAAVLSGVRHRPSAARLQWLRRLRQHPRRVVGHTASTGPMRHAAGASAGLRAGSTKARAGGEQVPGVSKEDIDVRIDGNQVTMLSAEVKKESEEKKGKRALRSERQYGFASRSFTLASDVDEAAAKAKVENGILELTLPKKAKSSAKKVDVA